MIIHGQTHGGIAQGVGQALMEQIVYDRETGQLITGSFMDYTMPRADNFPSFKLGYKVTPCPHNPLGVKGCGEAGDGGAGGACGCCGALTLAPCQGGSGFAPSNSGPPNLGTAHNNTAGATRMPA